MTMILRAEAVELAARRDAAAGDGVDAACWELAMVVDGECRSVARRWAHLASYDDVLQEARVGALEAARRWDPARGVQFRIYARWWIRSRLRAASRQWRTIPLPFRVHDRRAALPRVEAELQRRGEAATSSAIGEWLGCSSEDVDLLRAEVVGLDSPGELGGSLADTLTAEVSSPSADFDAELQTRWLQQCMRALPQAERQCLEGRYGLVGDAPLSLVAMGSRWGVSHQTVRKVQLKALAGLRELWAAGPPGWSVLATAESLSDREAAVYVRMLRTKGPLTAEAVGRAVGVDPWEAYSTLCDLHERGLASYDTSGWSIRSGARGRRVPAGGGRVPRGGDRAKTQAGPPFSDRARAQVQKTGPHGA